jgi:radical SAM protein with 4Fe4S-binding SPASM domain
MDSDADARQLTTRDVLDPEVLCKTFSDLASAGVKSVVVQGTGEPLMNKGLPAAIAAGSDLGLSISLSTNGVLLNDAVQEQVLDKLFYIRFSVLEIDPARYAFLHGCTSRQWHMLRDNVQALVARRKSKNLPVALLATVYLYEGNFDHAYDVVAFCKALGFDYVLVQEATFTMYSPVGKKRLFSDVVDPARIREMKQHVLELCDGDFVVKVRFPTNDENFFTGLSCDTWRQDFCQGIHFYSLIASDGEVYPCWRFWGRPEFSYGNIRHQSFEEIWRGERRQRIQRIVQTTPPVREECAICNVTNLNGILDKCRQPTDWSKFLI